MGARSLSEMKPLSLHKEGEKYIFFVPSNLESYVDDELIRAFLSAAFACRAEFRVAGPLSQSPPILDEKHKAYLRGIEWAFNQDPGYVPPYTRSTGNTGGGFNVVAHLGLTSHGMSAKILKGEPKQVKISLTSSAWAKHVPYISEFDQVVRMSSSQLKIKPEHKEWIRVKESFLGHDVKRKLPGLESKVISNSELDFLYYRHKGAVAEYNDLMIVLDDIKIADAASLMEKFHKVGTSLKELDLTVNMIEGERYAAIYYEKDKRRQKIQKTKDFKLLYNEVRVFDFIKSWDPCTLIGSRPYYVNPDSIGINPDADLAIFKTLKERCESFLGRGIDSLISGYLAEVKTRLTIS